MPYLLGKKPVRKDSRNLMFSKYLTAALPPIPDEYSWIAKDKISDWGMMKNDVLSDCVEAAWGHLIMSWTADTGKLFIPSDSDIVTLYSGMSGYNPITGANDDGTNELDSLKHMRNTGIDGHIIGAYTSVDTQNIQEVKTSIFLFGGNLLGAELPINIQNQLAWTIPPANTLNATAGSWGGHGICGLAYTKTGIYIITWGSVLFVNWKFFTRYFDECWAIISPDFVNGNIPSPNGFDMPTLISDLTALQ